MDDATIEDRVAAVLAKSRGAVSGSDVDAIVRDVLQPMNVSTIGEIATLAGRDYRDRQGLKRKALRWREMFSEMPPLERLTILRALASAVLPPSQD